MLVTIAAAALALASPERAALQGVSEGAISGSEAPRSAPLCRGAGRMQTAFEPTLLYRRGGDDRVRKLIDMPLAHACRVGGVR